MYQKSEGCFFDNLSRGVKNGVKVEKRPLVTQLKLKMSFSITTPPTGGTFELLLHFSYLWNIAQKSIIQIFDMLSIEYFPEFCFMYIRYPYNCNNIFPCTSATRVYIKSPTVPWQKSDMCVL